MIKKIFGVDKMVEQGKQQYLDAVAKLERQQKEKLEGPKKDPKSIVNSIENEALPEEVKELKDEIEKQSLKEV